MLCGVMCAKYILNNLHISFNELNLNLKWTPQIALYLNKKGLSNIKIYCYNSKLYCDYKEFGYSNLDFEGFKSIYDALSNNILIEEKKLDSNEIKNELMRSKFMILCVKSSIFNNDNQMDGGHFIILLKTNNNGLIKVINPIKDKYEIKYLSDNFLIDCCKEYGSWRILIGEE